MPRRRSPFPLASLAAALLACAVAVPRATAQFTTGAAAQQQVMPSVTGMSQNDASGRLQQIGMQVEVQPLSSSRPRGTVIRQQPSAGTVIQRGMVAVLGVSTGQAGNNTDGQTTSGGQTQPADGGQGGIDVGISVRPPRPGLVPNVVGMTLGMARARLIASALRPGRVDSAFVEGAEPGRVVAQSLRPGSQVIPGRAVRLTVQQRSPVATQPPVVDTPRAPEPPRRTLVAVPNLAGRTVAEARALVGGARLLLGDVASDTTSRARPGTVTAQRPAAGDSVEPGTLVRIAIARAPATVEVPNLVGSTPAEARTLLARAGLTAGTVTQREAEGRPHVLTQSVPAGTRVLRSTQVGFVVSRTPVVVRPDTPRTPAGAPVVDSAAQPQPATPVDSANLQPPVVVQPPAAPTHAPTAAPPSAPSPTPPGATTAPLQPGTTPPGTTRQVPPVPIPWRWIVIAAAVLVAAVGGRFVRSRLRRRAARRLAPAPASPIASVVTVRARGGEARSGRQPERPVEKGSVRIGMIVGAPGTPEPEPGAAALHPGEVSVRLVEGTNDDPLGAHPQRVIENGQIQIRIVGAEPALTADFDAEIFKGS